MIDRGHVQYAGRLDLATQLHLVRQGHGQSGPNRDYVLSTVHALEALGLYDRDLHLLAERLRGTHEGVGRRTHDGRSPARDVDRAPATGQDGSQSLSRKSNAFSATYEA